MVVSTKWALAMGASMALAACCVYDALFRGDARIDESDKPPDEVACWSHARRKVWEAAVVTKEPAAREALLRIQTLFKLEEDWAHLAPKQRHERRQRVTRSMLDEFFAWAEGVFERVRAVRGPMATAFGYAIRQRDALRRFLDDGRLRMENNASERALRPIAVDVSLCTLSSSARNDESAVVARNATRATRAFATVA